MRLFPGLKRIKDHFYEFPWPDAIFQLTPRYLTGIRVLPKERKTGACFITRLSGEEIQPSFDKKNLIQAPLLEEKIKSAMRKFGLSHGTAGILIPELCARVFILNLDSPPASQKEREKIIRWRVGKLMPALPEDARFVHHSLFPLDSEKDVVAVAKASVIGEYEDLFSRCQLAVGSVSLPSLCLLNLLSTEEDILAVNIEEDALSFTAVIGRDLALYRQKSFSFKRDSTETSALWTGALLKEIENTIFFLEDKEKKKIRGLWIRPGVWDEQENLVPEMEKVLGLPVHEIGIRACGEAGDAERNLLSPLFGQLE